jgi:hypothetical protein
MGGFVRQGDLAYSYCSEARAVAVAAALNATEGDEAKVLRRIAREVREEQLTEWRKRWQSESRKRHPAVSTDATREP